MHLPRDTINAVHAALHVVRDAVCFRRSLLGNHPKDQGERSAGRKGASDCSSPTSTSSSCSTRTSTSARPTSWVFRAGPIVGLASLLVAGLIVPLAGGSRADLISPAISSRSRTCSGLRGSSPSPRRSTRAPRSRAWAAPARRRSRFLRSLRCCSGWSPWPRHRGGTYSPFGNARWQSWLRRRTSARRSGQRARLGKSLSRHAGRNLPDSRSTIRTRISNSR